MPVNQPHPDYIKYISAVTKTRDACAGDFEVKIKGETYLPRLQVGDDNSYRRYLQRAYYNNVTGRTLEGLVGAIFRKPPEYDLPPELEYLLEGADKHGLSIEQVGKILCYELLQAGRCGILVDYPEVDGALTKAQVDAMGLRATMSLYPSEAIINWREDTGHLIVLKESYEDEIDEFTIQNKIRYRALSLMDGVYTVRLFDEGGMLIGEPRQPRGFDGSTLDFIPFVFAGAYANVPDMQLPPLLDIATVNIAQYINVADYESNLHIHCQGTLFISSDMTVEQFQAGNPNGIVVGGNCGHFLGANGKAELLQMQPSGASREAIQDKLDMMVALGAKLIQSKSGNETAEAARIKASSDASTLDTIVGNASEAIEQALEFATVFMGGNPEQVLFSLNRDFFDSALTAQDVMALIQLADRGDVAQADIRAALRKAGWIAANRTDEILDDEAEEVGPPVVNVAPPVEQ